MKTAVLLAASAMLCIGVGVAYADGGDDEGGTVANTFFTELPGVVPTAPGKSRIRSRRRLQKANTDRPKGSRCIACSTRIARPLMPIRKSIVSRFKWTW